MYSDALLVKTAELYYYSRISQAEIGRILGVSTPTVSRILQEAVERGIIEVRIRDVLTRNSDAEETLKKRFGLLDAVVVEGSVVVDKVAVLADNLLVGRQHRRAAVVGQLVAPSFVPTISVLLPMTPAAPPS